MSARLHLTPATTSLIVVECGASVPFDASGYRGTQDTAIVAQQPGESIESLIRRIRHSTRAFGPVHAPLETVVLIVSRNGHARAAERRSLTLALSELLPKAATLILVADGANAHLRLELLTLAGALIEEGHVEHSVAVDFDARHMAELRAAHAPLISRRASDGNVWSTAC